MSDILNTTLRERRTWDTKDTKYTVEDCLFFVPVVLFVVNV
jgi:hypothetical protein